MSTLPVTIRPAAKPDVPLITSSWLRNFRDAPFVRGVPNNTYYHQHHRILERLLPKSMVFVACNAEDLNQIMAWGCAEIIDDALVMHFMYTKAPFRRWGLAKKLLAAFIEAFTTGKGHPPGAVFYTHKSLLCPKLEMLKTHRIIYNPYLVFEDRDAPAR